MIDDFLQEDETVRSDYTRSEKPPSIAVVETIAAVENVPLEDLMCRLHDHIDPESLDDLVDGNSDVSVSFLNHPYYAERGNHYTGEE